MLALLSMSFIVALATGWAGFFAADLLRHWNPARGTRRQIDLERRTQFVATVVAKLLVLQGLAVLLMIHNAGRIAPLWVPCVPLAASTPASSALRRFMRSWPFSSLQPSGWLCIALIWWPPTIRSLIASTCSCWPSRHLPLQTPGLTLAYFIDLQPDTLTSCCGSTFRPDRPGLAAEISAIEPRAALCTLAIALASVLAFGAVAKRSRWMAGGYAVVSAAFFGVALAAVGAGISPYVYESPHHHCPFCLLEREYGYIGYALYAPLFVGESAGLSSGVLSLRPPPSLAAWLPARAGQLRRISMAGFVAFSVLAALAVMMSAIRL